MADAWVVGTGLHPFGRFEVGARELGVVALRAALADAGVAWSEVGLAAGGTRDGGNADSVLGVVGRTEIPFINVYNGCATGGSALAVAHDAVASGRVEVAVALGFDKHARGAFASSPQSYGVPAWYGAEGLMMTTQFFAMKIARYMHDHAVPAAALAAIAEKSFRNAALTPTAWRRSAPGAEEIAASRMINDPLTQMMFCSPNEGAAAVVLCSEDWIRKHRDRAAKPPVRLDAVEMRTRRPDSFEVYAPTLAAELGESPSTSAARAAFEAAGVGPSEVGVAQLQDTDAGAELMHLAECGFCEHGEQTELIASGGLELTGRLPVNTDGGCLGNGEPIGASGLRQVVEAAEQLRGTAGAHQVPGEPRAAFTHVYGAPGLSACTVMTR